MTKNIAIIPARIGSKRVPKKNIKKFFGRPIFLYSVDCAINSGLFDEVHVSTESDEVVELCEEAGITPKFMRPIELAHDDASLDSVCEHTLIEYLKKDIKFENFCLIWATSPMTLPSDIINSYKILADADAIVGTSEYELPFFSGHELLANDFMKPYFPHLLHGNMKRPTVVCTNSSFCWTKVDEFFNQKTWLPKKVKSYKMPATRSCDINTHDDWERAEYLYKKFKNTL